jgi:hypothetical protein
LIPTALAQARLALGRQALQRGRIFRARKVRAGGLLGVRARARDDACNQDRDTPPPARHPAIIAAQTDWSLAPGRESAAPGMDPDSNSPTIPP